MYIDISVKIKKDQYSYDDKNVEEKSFSVEVSDVKTASSVLASIGNIVSALANNALSDFVTSGKMIENPEET